ncbi:MAG: hypothetical protein WCP60_01775 [bacterium]
MMPSPLYDYGMLFLTRHEQIVLVLILTALIAGAGIRHFRMMHLLPGNNSATSNTH